MFYTAILFQADEHVVNKGLEDHPVERNALRSKPGTVSMEHVIAHLKSVILDSIKRT